MWTRFMDMHSGGGTKEAPYEYIYIEAPEDEAKIIFYNRFGHNPERVTCTCCGDDYSISSGDDLSQLTAHERNCQFAYLDSKGREVPEDQAWVRGKGMKRGYSSGYVERQEEGKMKIRATCKTKDSDPWGLYETLAQYKKRNDVLIITAKHIKPAERVGSVPAQGYQWVG